MPLAVSWNLEYFGQTAFGWWAVVSLVTGAALVAYAALLWREGRRAGQEGGREARGDGMPHLLGVPTAWVALAGGTGTLGITILLMAMRTPPHLAALLWMLATALGAVGLFYQRVFRYLNRGRMATLFLLRVTALGALAAGLFQPVLGITQRGGRAARLAVVIDASESMSTYDQPNEPHRYNQSVLAVQSVLAPRLAGLYDMQYFAYDGQHTQPLENAEALSRIAPAGGTTDLGAAVSLGTSQGAERVVLFSDGIHNGPATVEAVAAGVGAQVYTVKVGSSQFDQSTVPDIAVANVDGPQTATVNTQVALSAVIKSTALSDRTVRVQLMAVRRGTEGEQAGEEMLAEQRLVLHSGPTPQTVQLRFSPGAVGRMVVRVQVPVDPGERNEANNQQEFPLLVTDPKLAVLYVEGRVRPEVGPLRRVLEQDPNVNAISMVQTQAGKFELRGVKAGDDLKGLPTTLAQWKRFRVVVLGDIDAGFFNAQQQRDLVQAVKEGTGLLMIGGQNNFAAGRWNQTPLADLLPVSLAAVEPAQVNTAFVPQLTAAGAAHPIFQGIGGYFVQPDGKAPAVQMPQLSGCAALAEAKAGAAVLAVHPGAQVNGRPAIVLAVQQYGSARTGAFAADTTWHWNLFLRGMGKDSPYNRFWGQMVRWLAGQESLQKKTGPSVTAMIPKDRYEAGETVLLRAAVTDQEGQSTRYANVAAEIAGPDGKTARLPMAAVEEQIGVYEARYAPALAGEYQATFTARKDEAPLGQDKSRFAVMQAAAERDVLAANPAALQALAVNGGGYQELSGAAVKDLAERLARLVEPELQASRLRIPLYHTRWLFLLFIAALGLEWFFRRKWQLQ